MKDKKKSKKNPVSSVRPRGGGGLGGPTAEELRAIQQEGVTELSDLVKEMVPALAPFITLLRSPVAQSPFKDLLEVCNAGAAAAEASATFDEDDDAGVKWDLIAIRCANIADRLSRKLEREATGVTSAEDEPSKAKEEPPLIDDHVVDDTNEILGAES